MEFKTKKLNVEDLELMKQIRLEALRQHPNFFSPSRDESLMTNPEWKERLSDTNSASFGLFNEKNEIVGLTGIVRDKEEPSIAWMIASYIKAPFRRMGLADLLYQARIQWAKEQGDINTLIVHHREDNEISRKAHQHFNFKFTKMGELVTWPNGDLKHFVEYRLEIK